MNKYNPSDLLLGKPFSHWKGAAEAEMLRTKDPGHKALFTAFTILLQQVTNESDPAKPSSIRVKYKGKDSGRINHYKYLGLVKNNFGVSVRLQYLNDEKSFMGRLANLVDDQLDPQVVNDLANMQVPRSMLCKLGGSQPDQLEDENYLSELEEPSSVGPSDEDDVPW